MKSKRRRAPRTRTQEENEDLSHRMLNTIWPSAHRMRQHPQGSECGDGGRVPDHLTLDDLERRLR